MCRGPLCERLRVLSAFSMRSPKVAPVSILQLPREPLRVLSAFSMRSPKVAPVSILQLPRSPPVHEWMAQSLKWHCCGCVEAPRVSPVSILQLPRSPRGRYSCGWSWGKWHCCGCAQAPRVSPVSILHLPRSPRGHSPDPAWHARLLGFLRLFSPP